MNTGHKLLLIDDDTEVLGINQKFFSDAGYSVTTAASAKEGLTLLKKHHFSCIVLDVMLPDIDGFQACENFRAISDVPIIFLSGCVTEDDRIKGLMSGADDYMIKPYSLRELAARIEVNIRRHTISKKATKDTSRLEFPPLSIDLLSHKVLWDREEIPLSNREFELLHLLATRPGQAFTFKEIGEHVWGSYLENDRRSIMVNVSRLRKKLEKYKGLENLIESVWSKGYRFTGKET